MDAIDRKILHKLQENARATLSDLSGETFIVNSITGRPPLRKLFGMNGQEKMLGSLKVRLNQRAGDNGRLFGSVTSTDVAEAVKAAGGPEVDKRRIQIRNPIKSVGDYTVEIRLHPEVNVSLPIEVVGV